MGASHEAIADIVRRHDPRLGSIVFDDTEIALDAAKKCADAFNCLPREIAVGVAMARIENAIAEARARHQGKELGKSEDYWRGYRARLDEELVPLSEPHNPTLWRYLNNAHEKKIAFHTIGVNRMPDGGFHFYIHPQAVSGDTEDYLIWPDPFSWEDMIVNRKDSREPDFESFRKYLATKSKNEQ